jgi:two-component system chemotaxis response regulator CheB
VGVDGEEIQRGVIYLAPPDYHMLLANDHLMLGKGAPENGWRPSINNLFRSAAASYGPRVIGIILTGLLDDGSAGMSNIKRSGGTCIVQDPNEADYPDMPLSVLQTLEVDHCESLAKMGDVLTNIMNNKEIEPARIPEDVLIEARLDQRVSTMVSGVNQFEKLDVNCPDCGGGLYITQHDHPAHYRCHVGHSFTDRELIIRMSEVLESTFWTSLRMLEEKRALLTRFYKKDLDRGYKTTAERYLERANDLEVHIENLKQILFKTTEVDAA